MGNSMALYQTLTPDEITMIKTSWMDIHMQMPQCIMNLYVILYTNYPKMHYYFKHKHGTDMAELHCGVLMHVMDRMVDAIDDPNQLEQILSEVGKTHIARKIAKDDYDCLRKGILQMVRSHNGLVKFDKAMQRAWEKCLEVQFTYLLEFDQLDRKLDNSSNLLTKRVKRLK